MSSNTSIARVLITGSRSWPDKHAVYAALDDAYENRFSDRGMVVVHGAARGADTMAHLWARAKERAGVSDVYIEVHHANWRPNGVLDKTAGHKRNVEMVNAGADLVLAFIHNRSAGATGCMRAAMRAGLEVQLLRIDDDKEKQ